MEENFSKKSFIDQYNEIIDFYKKNIPDKSIYCEDHHIQPLSLGGPNIQENIIRVPGYIHYKIHCILPFVYLEQGNKNGYNKMIYAWRRLANTDDTTKILNNIDEKSAEYQELRIRFCELVKNHKHSKSVCKQISFKLKGHSVSEKLDRKLAKKIKGVLCHLEVKNDHIYVNQDHSQLKIK